MTRGLAIETAGRDGSVAVAVDGRVVAEASFPNGLRHAAGLLPLVARMIAEQGWRPGDLDHLYLSAGPGAFTGLRIGFTLAKALAVATDVRLVAVPTLSVVVQNAPAEAAHAVVLLDAKRGQVFTAAFDRDAAGDWVEREPPHVEELAAVLRRAPRPVHLLGEGIPYHGPSIPADDPTVIVCPAELWRPRAGVVVELGWAMATAGRFTEPDQLLPAYIRIAEAQEKYDAGLLGKATR
jgi:tRNA threonylcarbamoyladenosine biosynthesis protein TsaB